MVDHTPSYLFVILGLWNMQKPVRLWWLYSVQYNFKLIQCSACSKLYCSWGCSLQNFWSVFSAQNTKKNWMQTSKLSTPQFIYFTANFRECMAVCELQHQLLHKSYSYEMMKFRYDFQYHHLFRWMPLNLTLTVVVVTQTIKLSCCHSSRQRLRTDNWKPCPDMQHLTGWETQGCSIQ